MVELSLSQQYILLAADKQTHKLKTPIKQMLHTFAVGAGIAELLLDERIRLHEDGKLEVRDASPTGSTSLDLLLSRLSSAKKPKTMRKWMYDFYSRSTTRGPFFAAEAEPLLKQGLLQQERARLLLVIPVVRYVPNADAIDRIVQRIRAEMLERGAVDDKTALLVMLLDASRLLKPYFSSYERQELRHKLKELQDQQTGTWKMIRQIRQAIDEINAVIVSAGA